MFDITSDNWQVGCKTTMRWTIRASRKKLIASYSEREPASNSAPLNGKRDPLYDIKIHPDKLRDPDKKNENTDCRHFRRFLTCRLRSERVHSARARLYLHVTWHEWPIAFMIKNEALHTTHKLERVADSLRDEQFRIQREQWSHGRQIFKCCNNF